MYALILQDLAVYEKEPASVVKVTEEGDLNILVNDDNEAEYDLKNYAVWGECYSDFVTNSNMVRPGTCLVENHEFLSRGPFLESPGNFSGPKSNIQIEI